jgi:hypothetical protein
VWSPVGATVSVAAAGILTIWLTARALAPPERGLASTKLSALPAVRQNVLLEGAHDAATQVVVDPFTEYRLRADRRAEDESPYGLEDAFHAMAGNARALVACGIRDRRPACLVLDAGSQWRYDTPGWLASTAVDRLAPSTWRMASDAAYVYFLHYGVGRYSPETRRWHDSGSWDPPAGAEDVFAIGSTPDGLALCDRPWKEPGGRWRLIFHVTAGWKIAPEPVSRSRPVPVLCGVGSGFVYVVANSAGDRFPPRSEDPRGTSLAQTILVHKIGGLGWDEVYRPADDYMMIRDVAPLGSRLVALLDYSAGPMTSLGTLDVSRAEWAPSGVPRPDMERLTALSSFSSGLAVGGVLNRGGQTLGATRTGQAAVSIWQPGGSWRTEPLPGVTKIDALAEFGGVLFAAGSNRAGLLVAQRVGDADWRTVAATPVVWYDKLKSEVEVTAVPRLGSIVVAAASAAIAAYGAGLTWLNRRAFQRPVRVFISYRRMDVPALTGRVYDHLAARWGVEHVFKDVDLIQPGDLFPRVVEDAIRAADVFVALIGPKWAGVTEGLPAGRIHRPDDWVRREVETALTAGVPIVPVFGGVAAYPDDLPDTLVRLRFVNAIRVRDDPDFRSDVRKLERAVERAAKSRGGPPA